MNPHVSLRWSVILKKGGEGSYASMLQSQVQTLNSRIQNSNQTLILLLYHYGLCQRIDIYHYITISIIPIIIIGQRKISVNTYPFLARIFPMFSCRNQSKTTM